MIERGYTIPVLDHGFVRYIEHMGSDQSVVEAARVSYRSPSKGEVEDRRLLDYLWKHRHTSPFEMVQIKFNIKMPIFVMRQFVRHRMQSLNEVSARYSQLPAEFYIPTRWRRQDTKNKQSSVDENFFYGPGQVSDPFSHEDLSRDLRSFCGDAYKRYEWLLNMGVAREMARFVLPVNIYTEIYSSWDLRNLLHFFSLRDDPHAQWEHQQYGKAMKAICAELFPWIMEAYEKFKFVLNEQQVEG